MNLYDKHMVSSSSLRLKIKSYSQEIVGGNGRNHISCILCERQHVTLEHDTYLNLMSSLGHPHFVTCLPGFRESIFLSFDYILSTWLLILFWVKFCKLQIIVADMFKRIIIYKFKPLVPHLIFFGTIPNHSHKIYKNPLFHVDDVGNILALLQQITSRWLQLIIQEDDLETPFQYLRAYMPQWKVLHIRW